MTRDRPELTDALGALRDHHLSALLETMAGLIEAGADVEPEPWLRDAKGAPRRTAMLRLPARGDLRAVRGGVELPPPVFAAERPDALPVSFPTTRLELPGGFTLTIRPFPWQCAELIVEAGPRPPDWGPLRRWALEWMQPRVADAAPELSGALHALGDPRQEGDRFRLALDFGSAPLEAFAELCLALPRLGALRARLEAGRP